MGRGRGNAKQPPDQPTIAEAALDRLRAARDAAQAEIVSAGAGRREALLAEDYDKVAAADARADAARLRIEALDLAEGDLIRQLQDAADQEDRVRFEAALAEANAAARALIGHMRAAAREAERVYRAREFLLASPRHGREGAARCPAPPLVPAPEAIERYESDLDRGEGIGTSAATASNPDRWAVRILRGGISPQGCGVFAGELLSFGADDGWATVMGGLGTWHDATRIPPLTFREPELVGAPEPDAKGTITVHFTVDGYSLPGHRTFANGEVVALPAVYARAAVRGRWAKFREMIDG